MQRARGKFSWASNYVTCAIISAPALDEVSVMLEGIVELLFRVKRFHFAESFFDVGVFALDTIHFALSSDCFQPPHVCCPHANVADMFFLLGQDSAFRSFDLINSRIYNFVMFEKS